MEIQLSKVKCILAQRKCSLVTLQQKLTQICALFLQVRFQHDVYSQTQVAAGPTVDQPVSRQVFVVQDLEIRDRLAASQMNKFLYLYSSKEMPRKAHSNMVRKICIAKTQIKSGSDPDHLCVFFYLQLTVKALHMCPESGQAPQECCLRVSLMPLRLNIDQVDI